MKWSWGCDEESERSQVAQNVSGVLIAVLASISLAKSLLTASPSLIFVAFVMINACERCVV